MNAQELIEKQRNQVVYAATELVKAREAVKAFPEGYSRFDFIGNNTLFLKNVRGFDELLVLLAEIDHLGPELSNYYLESNDAIRLNFSLVRIWRLMSAVTATSKKSWNALPTATVSW